MARSGRSGGPLNCARIASDDDAQSGQTGEDRCESRTGRAGRETDTEQAPNVISMQVELVLCSMSRPAPLDRPCRCDPASVALKIETHISERTPWACRVWLNGSWPGDSARAAYPPRATHDPEPSTASGELNLNQTACFPPSETSTHHRPAFPLKTSSPPCWR